MPAHGTTNQTHQEPPFSAVATVPGDFLAPALSEAILGTAWLFHKLISIIKR